MSRVHAVQSGGSIALTPRAERARMSRVSQGLLVAYLLLKPFYLWDSGLPQVADAFMLCLICLGLLESRGRHGGWPSDYPLSALAFVYWTVLVNVSAMLLVAPETQFALASVMNVYNVGASFAVLLFARLDRLALFRSLFYGSVGTLAIQVLWLTLIESGWGSRATGSFNNPNQLAYFSLLCIILLILAHEVLQPRVSFTALAILAGLFLIVMSMSRAAIVAAGVVLVGTLLWPPAEGAKRKRFPRAIILTAAVVAVLFLIRLQAFAESALLQPIVERAHAASGGNFESVRGYDRITEHPEYWFQGAGEGAYWRFDATNELHSTLGNVQVSYGLIGTVLFGIMLYSVLRGASTKYAYVIAAVLAYGLAHNGLRNTVFWILLAVLASFGTDRAHADVRWRQVRN